MTEYLVDGVGAEAARRAGYPPTNAARRANELLKVPWIAAAIAEGQRQQADAAGISAARIVRELCDLALYDAGEFSGLALGGPDDIAALPERLRRAIVGWSYDREGRFVPRLSPKVAALDALAKHLGMYVTRTQQLGADGQPADPAPVHLVVIEG